MSKFVELLGEELGKQVQEKLGNGFIIGKEENYIAKHRFDEINDQLGEYKKMLSDRDSQLEELKKKAGDNKELNQRIQELEEQNKTTTEEYENKLSAQKFDYELEKELRNAGARNPKAVKALLNADEIKLEGSKITGLESQLEVLKKEEDYLFGETGLKGKEHNEGDGKLDSDYKENPWEPGKVSLAKQSEILDKNPGKAKKLIEKAGGNPSDYGLS